MKRTTLNPPLTLSGWLRWYALQPYITEIPAGGPLLEIGCGLGGFAARLDRQFEYVGYEQDRICAAVASSRVERGEVRCEALPSEPTRLFAALVAFEVLEHLEDDAGALVAWRDWIRRGGRIILSVPADPDRFGPSDIHVGHYRRYTPDSLMDVMRAAGYSNIQVRRYGAPLNYLSHWVRNGLVREAPEPIHERTAASGRWLQPSQQLGSVTWLTTLPFRFLQEALARIGFGLGLLATATSE
jgi:SAM-dependent methyltransferase